MGAKTGLYSLSRNLENSMLLAYKILDAFDEAIDIDPITKCWLWGGQLNGGGYGKVYFGDAEFLTHRLSFEIFKCPIPQGLTIDHLCRVRSCFNPDHLEAVSHKVNVLRGYGPSAINARKTSCIRGHEFTRENTSIEGKSRRCKECKRIYDAARYQVSLKNRKGV